MIERKFWNSRRVFLTGHTGFKGSWLLAILEQLGAVVVGYSLPPENPGLYNALKGASPPLSELGDVRRYSDLAGAMTAARPEIVVHMAAQPLVRKSYQDPLSTFAINTMGTANLLEAIRHTESVRVALVIVTDKCYRDRGWCWGYRENDELGGYDPYSASKAAAELVVDSFRNSFFGHRSSPVIASARAGNVIGGGDWAEDRLIPDLVRAHMANEPVHIRRPGAVRPWQHVLEALHAYLLLIQRCWECADFATAWNFGPDARENKTVEWIVRKFYRHLGGCWEFDEGPHPHETDVLLLDCSQAFHKLHWAPQISIDTAVEWTAEWYMRVLGGEEAGKVCEEQIANYLGIIGAAL